MFLRAVEKGRRPPPGFSVPRAIFEFRGSCPTWKHLFTRPPLYSQTPVLREPPESSEKRSGTVKQQPPPNSQRTPAPARVCGRGEDGYIKRGFVTACVMRGYCLGALATPPPTPQKKNTTMGKREEGAPQGLSTPDEARYHPHPPALHEGALRGFAQGAILLTVRRWGVS